RRRNRNAIRIDQHPLRRAVARPYYCTAFIEGLADHMRDPPARLTPPAHAETAAITAAAAPQASAAPQQPHATRSSPATAAARYNAIPGSTRLIESGKPCTRPRRRGSFTEPGGLMRRMHLTHMTSILALGLAL